MRTRKQLIAIILALKKKGMLSRLRKVGGSTQSPMASASKIWLKTSSVVRGASLPSFVSVGQKKIPYHASAGARKSDIFADSYSSSAIQGYLSALPEKDLSRLKIKGIYALTDHEFYRVIGGAARRTSSAADIQEGLMSLKAVRLAAGRVFVLGLHHNGRIFMNTSSLRKQAESVGYAAGADLQTFVSLQGKSLFLHELGHNMDSPSTRFAMGLRAGARELPRYVTSQSREFLRALGLNPKKASVIERGQAAEAFASFYAAYRMDKAALKSVYSRKIFKQLERIFDKS